MTHQKVLLLVFSIFSLCFVNACRMTESQIRQLPPEVRSQYASLEQAQAGGQSQVPVKSESKAGWFFLSAVLVIGAFLYFSPDWKDKKKASSSKKAKPVRRRKRSG